jgi:hypothetical protein
MKNLKRKEKKRKEKKRREEKRREEKSNLLTFPVISILSLPYEPKVNKIYDVLLRNISVACGYLLIICKR